MKKNDVKILREVASHRRKRGFTITELVIVIAVIAILAAVLIPTFANLINKANESADLQTVKNLNTILASEQTVSQKKPSTMSEALAQAAEGGYTVEKLSPTSEDNDILWNQTTNRFVLVDKDGKIIYQDESVKEVAFNEDDNYTYWKITDSLSEVEENVRGFSFYLGEDFSDPSVTAKAGIDVGEHTGIDVTYTGTAIQEIIFRTNGGSLTVDNAEATIVHYGSSDKVTVKAVASSSYHLYAAADEVTISRGRLYVEKSGSAKLVTCEVSATAVAPGSIEVDAASADCVGNIVINGPADTVVISDSLENKNITNEESPTLNETLAKIGKKYFNGGYGTESNPFKIETEQNLLNVDKLVADQNAGYARYCFIQTANIEIDANNWWSGNSYKSLVFSGVYDGGGYSITIGTERTNGAPQTLSLFELNGNAELRDLTLVSSANCMLSAATVNGSNAQNLTFDNVDAFGKDGMISTAASNSGFIIAGHIYSDYDLNLVIKNCDINASVTNTGDCTGVFIGGSIYWGLRNSDNQCVMNHRLTIENSTFKGTVYAKAQGGLIFGNQAGSTFYIGKNWTVDQAFAHIQEHLTLNNVKNEGAIFGGNGATVFGGSTQEIIVKLHDYYGKIVGGTFEKSVNVLDQFSFDVYYDDGFKFHGEKYPTGDYTYKLGISMSLQTSENSAMNGRQIILDLSKVDSVSEMTALTAGGFYLENKMSELGLTDAEKVVEDAALETVNVDVYVKDGKIYVIIANPAGEYPYPQSSNLTLTVYAYDSNGIIRGQARV